MNVTKSITVARPRGEVYAYWRDFENLPRFMRNLTSVENIGGGRSHWVVKSIAAREVEWDAEIVEDKRNERISWRTVGAEDDIRHAGSVSFNQAGEAVTEVRVDLMYDAPGGKIGATVARLFGDEPGQQIEQDLERFKRVLETGDVEVVHPRTDAADIRVADDRGEAEPMPREYRPDSGF
jgi:uncharacterized membrane protein